MTMRLAVLLVLVGVARCYKIGAPQETCVSMFPTGHNVTAQASSAPFTITTNTTQYKTGDVVSVTVTATSNFFEGILIQARKATGTDAVGMFNQDTDSLYQRMKCPADNAQYNAVTHTSSAHKMNKTFLWTNSAGGDVFFQATLVYHTDTFWTGVKSSAITESGASVESISVWAVLGLLAATLLH